MDAGATHPSRLRKHAPTLPLCLPQSIPSVHRRNFREVEFRRRRGDGPLERGAIPRISGRIRWLAPGLENVEQEDQECDTENKRARGLDLIHEVETQSLRI